MCNKYKSVVEPVVLFHRDHFLLVFAIAEGKAVIPEWNPA